MRLEIRDSNSRCKSRSNSRNSRFASRISRIWAFGGPRGGQEAICGSQGPPRASTYSARIRPDPPGSARVRPDPPCDFWGTIGGGSARIRPDPPGSARKIFLNSQYFLAIWNEKLNAEFLFFRSVKCASNLPHFDIYC